MQCRERKVPGLCNTKGELDRFQITHFADEDDVRILSQTGSKGIAERIRIGSKLSLRNDTVLVRM